MPRTADILTETSPKSLIAAKNLFLETSSRLTLAYRCLISTFWRSSKSLLISGSSAFSIWAAKEIIKKKKKK